MGAGKTTIGKVLAKELNMQFYDLDWYIESRMRKTERLVEKPQEFVSDMPSSASTTSRMSRRSGNRSST